MIAVCKHSKSAAGRGRFMCGPLRVIILFQVHEAQGFGF